MKRCPLFVTIGFWTILLSRAGFLCAEDSNDTPSDELKSERHKAIVAEFKNFLGDISIVRQGPTPIIEELIPEPVLNWDDLVRGHHHGTVWVWGDHGRPAAVVELFTNNFSESIGGIPGNVVHSLAPGPLSTKGDRTWYWAPDRPGFIPHKLAGAPTPAATQNLRRIQMRSLAKRFTANETFQSNRSELRLLTTPLRVYESPDEGMLDGGLFTFVHGGTNPEVILVLEAMEANKERYWQFGCVRLGHAEMQVKFDETELWKASTYGDPDPTSPYYWITSQQVSR